MQQGGNGGGGEFAMQPMLLLVGSQCLECNPESPGKTHPAADASCVFTMAMKRRGERSSDKEKEREHKTRFGLDRAQE